MLFGSIPSPTFREFSLGPLDIRVYGLLLGLAIVVGALIADRRWVRAGGERGVVGQLAVWVVLAGFIGARLYHVITDFDLYRDNLSGALEVWEGGLGIWGGVAAGVLMGWWRLRRMDADIGRMLWAVAPAVPVAQAVGRLGNWFNQELYGRPSDLPWAVEIDFAYRATLPPDLATSETFHPTFLYEALWNLALAAFLMWVAPRLWQSLRQPNGALFALYVAGYTLGRFWIELLRVDEATEIAGVRVNVWVSVAVFVAAVVTLVVAMRREPTALDADPSGEPASHSTNEPVSDPTTAPADELAEDGTEESVSAEMGRDTTA